MRILLIENDLIIGEFIRIGLNQDGYTVDWLKDSSQAEFSIQTENFDAIILNLKLPEKSGNEILNNIRKKGINTPVILLTETYNEESIVLGLDNGADAYIMKPCEITILSAYLRALQRRASGITLPIYHHKDIELNPAAHCVTQNGKYINISPKEFSLLKKMLESSGRVLSREQLAESLYGWDNEIESNAVEVHVHNIRKKLGNNIIRTIRGVGYMVEKPQK